MKLFSAQLTKLKFIMLLIFGLIEIIGFIIIFYLYKPIYLKLFEQMKEPSLIKTETIAKSLHEITKLIFIRYTHDLKFIAKHMSLLANGEINMESEFFYNLINNEDKHIYDANLEELKNHFPEYYDNSQQKFLYLENYIKNYIENKTNQINILNDLMNSTKHPELNSISFCYSEGNASNIEKGSTKEIAAKYFISILKTVFIKKLITKGRDFDVEHFFLLTDGGLFIYPPDALNNTFLYSYSHYCDNFPECILEMVNSDMDIHAYVYFSEDCIFPVFPFPRLEEDKYIEVECLSIPFEEPLSFGYYSFSPKICMELNITKMFLNGFFESKEAFHFLYFTCLEDDIIIIYNDNSELFSEIRKVFNDPRFKKYYYNYENKEEIKYFYFFQFLYLDLFKEPYLLKDNNITLDDLFKEYEIIKKTTLEELDYNLYILQADHFTLNFEKTTCKSDIYYNNKTCFKDNFLIIIYPFLNEHNVLDGNYIENPEVISDFGLFYSMTILDNNFNYFKWKLNKIILIIMIKLFAFFLISSICLYFLYFSFIQIFLKIEYNPVNQIINIIKKSSFFQIKDKNEIFQKKQEIIINANNKEIYEIKNFLNYLLKIMMLKIHLKENDKITNNNSTNSNTICKIDKIDMLNQFIDIIKDIDNKEANIILLFKIAHIYFKKGMFKSSENICNNLIKEINLYQKTMSNKKDIIDSNLKDKLSRCSKISYLNEYSLTNELSQNILKIIKIKFLFQKIYYLYGLNLFNHQKIKTNSNKKYNKENSKKRYEEAIKYFIESKSISKVLGTNIISQIFSLIMISRCYLELKNYKEAMININEALFLFSDLQKAFKDKHYFNTKIMMFTENYIFQIIILTMSQTTFSFKKYPQSCWILMKMLETSPFAFNNIHFQACSLLYNSLTKIENYYNLPFRQIDKYKKRINKMYSRISIRLFNNIVNMNKGSSSNTINIDKEKYTNNLTLSISSLYHLSNYIHKNISLCISEKIIKILNGDELKSIIIKYFKKCFSNGENEFCFIQFSHNGKKTVNIKSDSLEFFLQKLEMNKIAFQTKDIFNKNNNEIKFMEFSR